MTPLRVVVIGYGMAGARLADEIRRHDPTGDRVALTVLGEEPHPAYNRVLLSRVVDGSLSAAAIQLHSPDWARLRGVDLRVSVAAVGVDRLTRRVLLDDGSTVGYDALVLATGSRPWIPPTVGLLTEDGSPAAGVVPFRTLDDCRRTLALATTGAPAAVLGGGLLGLEVASGLIGRGGPVTIVHPVGHLMDRQLDAAAGWVLARVITALGIELRLGALATRYIPGDGLKLDDGSHVPAGLVVVSAGVRAETTLASDAGLTVDRGVPVDDALRTADPRIYAIGDCAQHPGTMPGLVQPAWEQAAVLAAVLTGADPAARYRGTPMVTRLKARGVDLAALGDVHADHDEAGAEVLRLEDPARGRYAKLVVRDDRVAGAIVLGSPGVAATITQRYDRGTRLPADRMALLLDRFGSTAGADDPVPAICHCNSVTTAQLREAWQAGARDVQALATATRATTGCGGCREGVRALVREFGAS